MSVSFSVQKEGAGTREKRARKRLEETATGFHRCPASDFTCNIQREQASVQRVTNHHLSAAGPGARHRQQLLHERSPAESR